MSDGSDWKVLIDDNGVYIVNPDNEKVTKYMDSITLGKDDGTQSYLFADYHSLQMIDKERNVYFHISDLRRWQEIEGERILLADVADAILLKESQSSVILSMNPFSEATTTVRVNGISTPFSLSRPRTIIFSTPLAAGDLVDVSYKTASMSAKALTFGVRSPDIIGAYSVALGTDVVASGAESHAEGAYAEARGQVSHAEGYMTKASGSYAHAQNSNTLAGYEAQTAIGKFNENKDDTAFEIGNGTDDDNRSNALEITWGGKVKLPNKQSGVYLTDKNGFLYPLGYDNGANLWIGAPQTAAQHHAGQTFISSGYDGTEGNKSVKISVPNASNDNASNYDILHTGYTPTAPTISITATTGTLVETDIKQYGKVVQLHIKVKNTSSVAAGANIFTGTINTAALRPTMWTSSGSYRGSYSLAGGISPEGNITIRNATDRAHNNSDELSVSFTYLIA